MYYTTHHIPPTIQSKCVKSGLSSAAEAAAVHEGAKRKKKIQLGQFSVTTRSFSGGCGFGHHYTHHRYQLSCFQMQNSAVQKQDSGSGIRHAPHYLSVPRILESLLLDGHHYSICIIIPFNSIIIGLITEILLFLLN